MICSFDVLKCLKMLFFAEKYNENRAFIGYSRHLKSCVFADVRVQVPSGVHRPSPYQAWQSLEKSFTEMWGFLLFKSYTSNVHQLLLQFDNHYKKLNNPKKILSTVLAQTFKTKRLLKSKRAGIKEMLVALPKWVNNDGSLKS